METPKVNITLAEGQKEATVNILQGQSVPHIIPQAVAIYGDINAVSDFILTREATLDKKLAVIIFNEEQGTIRLNSNPAHPHHTVVTAKLVKHQDLNEFGINTPKYFGLKELEKLIRMFRFYFSDKEAHLQLTGQLKSFTAKVYSDLKNESDNRGNKSQAFNKKVESDLAAEFTLHIPIYKGQSPATFRVEICYDVTDSAVRFWLESVELFELEKQAVATAFEPQIKAFRAANFTVICE